MGGYVLDPLNLCGPTILDNELLVKVRDQSATCDGGLERRVKLLVPLGSELSSQIFQGSVSVHIFVSVSRHPGHLFGQVPPSPNSPYVIVSPGPCSDAWVHIIIPISWARQSIIVGHLCGSRHSSI